MKRWRRVYRAWLGAPVFSPRAFLVRAFLIAAAYGLSELAGLREYTSFLSGTSANPELSTRTASLLGVLHLLLYVGFIVVVPILVLAAGLLAGWGRCEGARTPQGSSKH